MVLDHDVADPCSGVECPTDQACVTNDDREPVCRCNIDVYNMPICSILTGLRNGLDNLSERMSAQSRRLPTTSYFSDGRQLRR